MENTKKGFTLLELLIVISIIVLLGIILIFALNPAETLAKSRDAQRISDLATLKTAIAVYTTTVSSPDLDTGGTGCLDDNDGVPNVAALVHYSAGITDVACDLASPGILEGDDVTAGSTFEDDTVGGPDDVCAYVDTGNTDTDGTGWLPVNFNAITGGSPISALPLDPTNDMTVGGSTATVPTDEALVYRYVCQQTVAGSESVDVFEINAVLESTTYSITDDLDANDGGDAATYYEVGTSVRLLGNTTNY